MPLISRKMPSHMEHSFSQVPEANIPRSLFNRSHSYKTTFDAGYLIPFYVDEFMPADTFNVDVRIFARLNTPVTPFMDNLYLDVHFFAVPLRLIWDNAKKFFGERVDPADTISYTVPQVTMHAVNGCQEHSLYDYFGVPIDIAGLSVSAFFSRAYNLIWNEWYRDTNLQDSVTVDTDNGPDTETDYVLLRRGKRKDYFTSCLPWPYRYDSTVSLPLGTSAPVEGIGAADTTYGDSSINVYETDGSGTVQYADAKLFDNASNRVWYGEEDPNNAGYPNIRANLANATAATIADLREAISTQQLMERDARGGNRYIEIVRSHFGVVSPDARQQRPEYLGGSSAPVNIVPIVNNEGATNEQGYLTGVGTLTCDAGFTKSFTEHGVIMGICSVRADMTYQEGLPRMFRRSTRYDYYWPTLAHLGEQAVDLGELYADGTSSDDDPFGYQERWSEYRYGYSKITGYLRSTSPSTLEIWHLGLHLGASPTLNSAFIQENPDVDRVVATPAEPHFVMDSFIKCNCARPMPVFSVPGLKTL